MNRPEEKSTQFAVSGMGIANLISKQIYMQEIKNEKVVFDKTLTIEEAEIDNGKHTYSRTRVKRQDSAAVLVYNTLTDKIILTRQFRYPIATKIKSYLLEILAGKVDNGEDALGTAIREAEEEVGYKIKPEKIQKIASCFVSPGYTSELLHLFYAEVTDEDQTDEGGGLASEHEEIEVVEIKSGEFIELVRSMSLSDAKTLLAGYWFMSVRNKEKV